MPTERRRWTSTLEEYRAGAEATAGLAAAELAEAYGLIDHARRILRADPAAANTLLLEALAAVSRAESAQRHIQNLMLKARIGRE